jgi:hypothetical protein
MAALDSVPSGMLQNVGSYFAMSSVTAFQGTPVHYMPGQSWSDGLHPVQAGPVDSVTGAGMVVVLFCAAWQRPRVE